VAEEANISSAGDNWACSNERGREDKYSSSKGTGLGGYSKKRFLCYGSEQREKLLCLWRIWAHGSSLQELGKRKSGGGKKTGICRRRYQGKFVLFRQFKRGGESRVS